MYTDTMGMFLEGTDIFENEDVLREKYTPNELLERNEEKQDFRVSLKSIKNRDNPSNIFVYGQTGMGKTLATRMITEELQDDMSSIDISVEVVWVNCHGSTSYDVAISITNQLRSKNDQISTTGYKTDDVYEMLYESIDNCGSEYVIMVLDEVDNLGKDAKLLYEIPRAQDNGYVEETIPSVIGISNDFKYRERLDSKIQSSLGETEIHFKPYDAHQLRSILDQRAKRAFPDDTLGEAVIPYIAAVSSQDTGSARHAINVLHKSGQVAWKNDSNVVTREHAEKAVESVEKSRIMSELRSLTTQGHLILYTMALFEKEGKTPVKRKEMYDVYKTLAERFGINVKSGRTIHNRLGELSLNGFLSMTQVNQGERGGRHNHYELDMPTDAVIGVLREHSDYIQDEKESDEKNRSISEY